MLHLMGPDIYLLKYVTFSWSHRSINMVKIVVMLGNAIRRKVP